MAIQYTLEQALSIKDCDLLSSLIDNYTQFLIPTADAELRALSISGNNQTDQIEQKRNDLMDLAQSLGNLESAYIANNCVSGINVNTSTPQPAILVSSPLNFNSIATNAPETKQFTVTNIGTADLILTGYIAPTAPFGATGPEWSKIPKTLIPGEIVTFSVNFSPIVERGERTVVTFFSNAKPTPGSNNSITITGTGVKPADIGVENKYLGRKSTGTKRIFVLRNIREVFNESNNNPDINSPYFDARKTKHSPRILADIYQCYSEPNRQQKREKLILEGVAIGKGVGSFWYEDCDQFIGGLLPAYQYYYDINQIENVNSWFKVDTRSPLDPDYLVYDINNLFTFNSTLSAISEELQNGGAEWGNNANEPDKMSCDVFQGTANRLYLRMVVDSKLKLTKKSVKIYDGRSDQ